jgi:hypothetical protein
VYLGPGYGYRDNVSVQWYVAERPGRTPDPHGRDQFFTAAEIEVFRKHLRMHGVTDVNVEIVEDWNDHTWAIWDEYGDGGLAGYVDFCERGCGGLRFTARGYYDLKYEWYLEDLRARAAAGAERLAKVGIGEEPPHFAEWFDQAVARRWWHDEPDVAAEVECERLVAARGASTDGPRRSDL